MLSHNDAIILISDFNFQPVFIDSFFPLFFEI